jgi:hypothetical protein
MNIETINKDMITIDNKEYTLEEITQVFDLCRDLLRDNETMRANVIAMSAKLDNEEAKVRRLLGMINYKNEINRYEA